MILESRLKFPDGSSATGMHLRLFPAQGKAIPDNNI
jgi:hypothetical protein